MKPMKVILAAVALTLSTFPLRADELLADYVAFIGQDDLYNSKGTRLSEPWQILRQDRANYHRFGVSQPGDEWDPLFQDKGNRAIMERMVQHGSIAQAAGRSIVQGGVMVRVKVYDNGSRDYLRVTVTR
ncbi:hypothetical protein RSK20926_13314 [Roseobacter sp. SK209-2-6]|uniref:hypothetical protein n=1 Tax=Roseobacter sp. SK209-2-6 TaxID=388739 RepID=UPI0000F3C7B3|nr:hypothetical protein [Roseobacter sp. SK209-2-6]EBA18704.1 hypothetical protein RSK20926_13314 [Roseobacter sp. SK209-2-6]